MPVPSVQITKSDNLTVAYQSQKHKVFYAGYFEKGEIDTLTPVYSNADFINKFGKPSLLNMNDWLMIYNYFQYNNNEIILSRIIGEHSINASASYPFIEPPIRIDNINDFVSKPVISNDNIIRILAKTPGEWANNIVVSLFTKFELDNNVQIYKTFNAKNIVKILGIDEYCLCVFQDDKLLETFVFNDSNINNINNISKYIFIIFDYKKYKLYDGNINHINGNIILADGNEINTDRPVFYGSNCLKLRDGVSSIPSAAQINTAYEDIGNSDEVIFDFILANDISPNAAINLADKRNDCCAFVGIPKNSTPETFIKTLNKSNNVIVYAGCKLQAEPFSGQKYFVSCIGDILGLRTYLINNKELSESHCKIIFSFFDTNIIDKYYTEQEIKELYDLNINVVKKGYSGIYAFSENMLLGQKLTNRIIYFNLVRDCRNVARYYLFEHNDELTRNDLKNKISQICQNYKYDNNIDDFRVICDKSNNSNPDNNLYVDVYYKPKYIVEEIRINLQVVINL